MSPRSDMAMALLLIIFGLVLVALGPRLAAHRQLG